MDRGGHVGAVLSLDQIRSIRSKNEYTEGPVTSTASSPSSATSTRQPSSPSWRPSPPPRTLKHERTHEVIVVNVNNNNYGNGSTGGGFSPSSGSSPPFRHVVRTQPKSQTAPLRPLFPPSDTLLMSKQAKSKGESLLSSSSSSSSSSSHQLICESCGKCKCMECTSPRPLPSRMVCDGQCVCSAESVLEHSTCMCLVKGLFYHCSSEGGDDAGDSCADRPCSLSRPRCPARFLCMALMAPVFPCLLCYPPCKGCLKVCQVCHDRLHRPGCRCKNSNAVYCWRDGQGHALTPGKPT
ncbi:protein sprouty homolog 1 [Ictalurus furcatus]|uniref:protein sprouty homolog 1 n=1 Tax=Ictalurus furcatus TaxID=66913 RepID=UPI0023503676|nr:protein sprouty homolog 1 [Ictalurus furcatus]